jgi:glycosyltransferase involved in cell wall biosynthesis
VPVTAHTFHGHVLKDYFGRLPSWLLAQVERRLARRTDALFAVSSSCRDELVACGVASRDRLVVTPPAVAVAEPLSRVAARRELSIPADQWRVCAIGRLVRIKRMSHFVEAVARHPDLHGDVIGDGPTRSALEALAARLVPGRVAIRAPEPEIAALLPAYDAVVLPSVREGCPLVAIEAFAAGVPVVGYDVPGVRDALSHFGRGVLVPEADGPAGLVGALVALRGDDAARQELVSSARGAVDACAPAAVAAQLLGAYRDLAARRSD